MTLIFSAVEDIPPFTVIIERLVKKLKNFDSLPHLSPKEYIHLLILIQAIIEACTI